MVSSLAHVASQLLILDGMQDHKILILAYAGTIPESAYFSTSTGVFRNKKGNKQNMMRSVQLYSENSESIHLEIPI